MFDVYKKIKELRKEQNLSQEELAKLTGYTNRSSIAKIEAGHVDLPLPKVETFAKALNTTPEVLMGYENIEADNELYKASADLLAEELTITEQLAQVLASDPQCAQHEWTDDELLEVLEFARFRASKR